MSTNRHDDPKPNGIRDLHLSLRGLRDAEIKQLKVARALGERVGQLAAADGTRVAGGFIELSAPRIGGTTEA